MYPLKLRFRLKIHVWFGEITIAKAIEGVIKGGLEFSKVQNGNKLKKVAKPNLLYFVAEVVRKHIYLTSLMFFTVYLRVFY